MDNSFFKGGNIKCHIPGNAENHPLPAEPKEEDQVWEPDRSEMPEAIPDGTVLPETVQVFQTEVLPEEDTAEAEECVPQEAAAEIL